MSPDSRVPACELVRFIIGFIVCLIPRAVRRIIWLFRVFRYFLKVKIGFCAYSLPRLLSRPQIEGKIIDFFFIGKIKKDKFSANDV